MESEENIEKRVSDAITGKPIVFTLRHKVVKAVEEARQRRFLLLFRRSYTVMLDKEVEEERTFSIEPSTLGKMQILSRLFLELDLDEKALADEPLSEAMRVSAEKTDEVCRVMAVAVCNTREELMDVQRQTELAEFFKWNAREDDHAVLLLSLLEQQNYKNFIASIRLMKTFRLNKPIGSQEAGLVELSAAAPSGAESSEPLARNTAGPSTM